jgi:hypothetical protein
VGGDVRRIVIGAEPEILVQPVGIDNFTGVHFPIRIPNRFEFAKRLDQLWTIHLGKKFGARLSVAVFAGE